MPQLAYNNLSSCRGPCKWPGQWYLWVMDNTNSIRRTLHVAAVLDNSSNNYVPVHWRLDDGDRQGVIHVNMPEMIIERRVVAELCALNYLMTGTRPIFGNARAPATSITKVTAGAIRKLFRGETEKGEIVPFGRFLFFAFCEAALETDKNIEWTTKLPIVQEMRIEATPTRYEAVPLTAMKADVGITRHAVERYQERVGTTTVVNSIKSLRRLMADKKTVPAKISDFKRDSGLQKYGKLARFFVHGPSKTTLVVLPEEDGWVLVTVYYEPLPRKEAVYVNGRVEMRNR